jgi:uncharacterized oligopeptide transporter (OPT) family protein
MVPAFRLLVPDAHALGGARFPAPAAAVIVSVAKVLAGGFAGVHPSIKVAMTYGAVAGGALSLAERVLPRRLGRFLPSASGVGLAFLLPASTSLAMLVGALAAAAYARGRGEAASERITTVASGLIMGESVVGVALALLAALGVINMQ